MSAALASILSPMPASMSNVCLPRTSNGRIPNRIRLRSSGRRDARPERLRDDAEHRAAIEPEEAIAERHQLEVAERVEDGLSVIRDGFLPPGRAAGDACGGRVRIDLACR